MSKEEDSLSESLSLALRQIASSGDIDILKSYLNHVHKKMPQKHLDRFEMNDLISLITPDGVHFKNADVAQTIVDSHPLTEYFAALYIDQFIMSERRDEYSLIDHSIKALGSLKGLVFFESVAMACPEIARKIVKEYGSECLIESISIPKHNDVLVNNRLSYALSYHLTHRSNQELIDAIKIGNDNGLSEIFELGRNAMGFFHKSRVQEDRIMGEHLAAHLSLDNLPILTDGVIASPELLFCMKERLDESVCVEAAFERIPFLAKKEDAVKLNSVRIYDFKQKVLVGIKNNIRAIDYCNMPLVSGEMILLSDIPNTELAFKPVCISSDCSEPLYLDDARIHYMVDNLTKMGLRQPKGYFLCIADVNELIQMNARQSSIEKEKMNTIEHFMNDYNLFQVMTALDADLTIQNSENGKREPRKFLRNVLYKNTQGEMSDKSHETHIFIKEVARSEELLSEAVHKMGGLFFELAGRQQLSTEIYINLFKNGGYNNEHYEIRISTSESIEQMYKAGFRFMENSHTSKQVESSNVILDGCLDLTDIVMLNKMQLWPEDNLTRPKSVSDCLNKLADTPDNIFLKGYLLSKGIEAAAVECKTEAHWDTLFKYFEEDHEKILSIMPRKNKRLFIESSLDV